jgi:hypothetical protein
MHHFSEASWQTFMQTLGLREHPLGIYYTSMIQITRFYFLHLPSIRTPITLYGLLEDFKPMWDGSDG